MLAVEAININLKGLEKHLKEIEAAKYRTEVGFFPRATYADGKKVAYIAYLNEFGGHNPPRPFMKRTVEKQKNAWTNLYGYVLKTNGVNKDSIYKAHKQVGIVAVGDMKKTIQEWSPTDPRPNAPSTIKAKARRARGGKGQVPINPNTVLIDTGVMIRSIQHEVKQG